MDLAAPCGRSDLICRKLAPQKRQGVGLDQEIGCHVVVLGGALFFGELLFPELNHAPLADDSVVGQEISCRESCLDFKMDLFGELELLKGRLHSKTHTQLHLCILQTCACRAQSILALYDSLILPFKTSCCCCVISDNCPVANLVNVLNIVFSVHEQCPNAARTYCQIQTPLSLSLV